MNDISAVAIPKHKKPVTAGRVIVYIVLALYALWIMAPFVVMIVTSFTPDIDYAEASSYVWWPKHFSMDGYRTLFLDDQFAAQTDGFPTIIRGFVNMLWMTLIPLVSGLLQSLLVAYCYSKWDFPFKNFLFMFTVALMFVPLSAFAFVGYLFY